ncbi:MAG: DUF4040 domain-containing protein [Anaerolineae bacterium]|nr:DUF4040 domain-containing protein [Anaerolineae bacterium]
MGLGFLLDPLFIPLLETAVPKEFELYLFAGFNDVFAISVAAITSGFLLFLGRAQWLNFPQLPIQGARVFDLLYGQLQQFADLLLKSQSGKLRYYLVGILGAMALFLAGSGLFVDLFDSESLIPEGENLAAVILALDAMLLVLVIISAVASVFLRQHIYAVMALGIMGYAVAGIFFIEPAPDVALVQFLVETLATLLLIVVISRTSADERQKAMRVLWKGQHPSNMGIWRDAAIALIIGFSVFVFAAVSIANRPERATIGQWHLDNADPQLGIVDVVAAILTDFRGMDTLVEISVFAMAALGILALVQTSRLSDPNTPQDPRTTQEIRARGIIPLSTPFTRVVATVIFPVTTLIAIVHLLYGARAPGDGFTAGVMASLGVAAWYVVFGYEETRRRLSWLEPRYFIGVGMGIAVLNALTPIWLEGGAFMGFLRIEDFEPAGLKFSTTLGFELAIALTVFGAATLMIGALANPADYEEMEIEEMDYLDTEPSGYEVTVQGEVHSTRSETPMDGQKSEAS